MRSCSVASSAASTVFYDEDGMPAMPRDSVPQSPPKVANTLLQPNMEQTPLTSTTKARKRIVFGKQEESTPAKSVKHVDVQLFKPTLSFSSNSDNPRAELCCKGPDGKRVDVFGSTAKQHGANLEKDAKALRDHIEANPGIPKASALMFNEEHRAK